MFPKNYHMVTPNIDKRIVDDSIGTSMLKGSWQWNNQIWKLFLNLTP